MRKVSLALAILALAMLACSQQVSTPLPTLPIQTATALATATKLLTQTTMIANAWTATVKLPTVNVREEPGGKVIGSVSVGKIVTIEQCDGSWCEISSPVRGYIFRGCLSDNPENKGCEAK